MLKKIIRKLILKILRFIACPLFLEDLDITHLELRKEETAMKEQTYYLMRGMIRPIVKTMT